MTKSALDMFSKCMAVELGDKGIRVNTVSPGCVRTTARMTRGEAPEDTDKFYNKVSERYPVGRHGVPEDMATAIMYLASDSAAFITGTVLVADGGHLAGNVDLSYGKVVLITGSSTGIGAQTAIQFAKSGAQVVVTGRNGQRVSDVGKQCSDISPKGLKALEVLADVSKEDDCKRLIQSTVEAFNRIDVLVNNAGFGLNSRITDEDYCLKLDTMFASNVKSAVRLTQLSVKYLEKTKGSIVNISSISGLIRDCPNISGYCMTKSALDMFSKCMAVELGDKGIRVNTVSPGCVRTTCRITRGETPEDTDKFYNKVSERYPIGRHGVPEDMATAIMYLASDRAAFLTGTILVSDGGHLAGNVDLSYGKVVLITGSSAGIGAQTALQFAKSGAQVVVTGRNGQRVSDVGKQCSDISPKVLADVSKEDDCKRLIQSTVEAFNRIDVLVNNAGFVELGPKGIRVNAVSPGAVRTSARTTRGEALEDTDKFYNKVSARYPVGKHGVPEDIANAVMYLASDTSSFITGTVLVADGGNLAANVNLTST
ncbi:unnamed protein product [Oppiella nova]|uniref:Uncharacterized protein n=1 Tax=Oppiella nova TaxID=334625 RepID=A0A7R9QB81_9ACAR|nr:unnamed protein product [Oppiella nova]CAG2161288.1 unnamed protein product [Oppiella nova]